MYIKMRQSVSLCKVGMGTIIVQWLHYTTLLKPSGYRPRINNPSSSLMLTCRQVGRPWLH